MAEEPTRLNLFPLGEVLFPGLPLPLHIFEERYKRLVTECIQNDEPFGIVFTEESQMHTVGCTARIEEGLKRYADGRLDIVTRGERLFRLIDVFHTEPYISGTIAYLDDGAERETAILQSLLSQAVSHLERLAIITGSDIDLDALYRMDPERASFLVSGLDAFSPAEKQLFLEISSTSQRLLACAQALVNVVQTYDMPREAKELLPEGRLLHRFN